VVREVSEQNKQRRVCFEVWSSGDLERLDELLAADVEALRSLRGGFESLVFLGSPRAFVFHARARVPDRAEFGKAVWDGKDGRRGGSESGSRSIG
jgi:hypothetical protein